MERRHTIVLAVLAFLAGMVGVAYYFVLPESAFGWHPNIPLGVKEDEEAGPPPSFKFPGILLEKVYNAKTDFRNEKGIVPSFWDGFKSATALRTANATRKRLNWGPCIPPHEKVDWEDQINQWYGTNHSEFHGKTKADLSKDFAGYCRPGFLIIGAAKCGTSSLYHYLTEHPRVLPAIQKQVHYFLFYKYNGLRWYLAHFPTTISFLSAGALMTGEASPGYLPFPWIPYDTKRALPGMKMVTVGRDPIERAWSSYNYEYVNPLLESMKAGNVSGVPKNQTDEFYRDKLFPFEELLQAELKTLKECLAPNGPGAVLTKQAYGNKTWAKEEFARREREGLSPLIDILGRCYGKKVSDKIPRKQFAELVEKYPDKQFILPTIFILQALLGLGLYVFQLEWWYAMYRKEDLYFICTEEMRDLTGEPLNQIGLFLGLPSFDFSSAVSEGEYNAAGHEGFDTKVSWEELEEGDNSTSANATAATNEMPLSEEFRQELLEFFKPYNERLYELTGRRCKW